MAGAASSSDHKDYLTEEVSKTGSETPADLLPLARKEVLKGRKDVGNKGFWRELPVHWS